MLAYLNKEGGKMALFVDVSIVDCKSNVYFILLLIN